MGIASLDYWGRFTFPRFAAQSEACPMTHEVFKDLDGIYMPSGIKTTNPISPTNDEDIEQYILELEDGTIPYLYRFFIKATLAGGRYLWSDEVSLQIFCPDSVPIHPS